MVLSDCVDTITETFSTKQSTIFRTGEGCLYQPETTEWYEDPCCNNALRVLFYFILFYFILFYFIYMFLIVFFSLSNAVVNKRSRLRPLRLFIAMITLLWGAAEQVNVRLPMFLITFEHLMIKRMESLGALLSHLRLVPQSFLFYPCYFFLSLILFF